MWYNGIKDDRRILSTYSEHVYKDIFWVNTSVIINYCTIFRCNANANHNREQILFILRFHANQFFFRKLKLEVSWKPD